VRSASAVPAISLHLAAARNYPADCQQQLVIKYKPNTRVVSQLLTCRCPELTRHGKGQEVPAN